MRTKPTREQVQAAEALYARVKQERESGRQTIRIHAGGVRSTSVWDNNLRKRYRAGPTLRLAAMMLPLMLVSLVPGWMGWNDGMAVALQTLRLVGGGGPGAGALPRGHDPAHPQPAPPAQRHGRWRPHAPRA